MFYRQHLSSSHFESICVPAHAFFRPGRQRPLTAGPLYLPAFLPGQKLCGRGPHCLNQFTQHWILAVCLSFIKQAYVHFRLIVLERKVKQFPAGHTFITFAGWVTGNYISLWIFSQQLNHIGYSFHLNRFIERGYLDDILQHRRHKLRLFAHLPQIRRNEIIVAQILLRNRLAPGKRPVFIYKAAIFTLQQ